MQSTDSNARKILVSVFKLYMKTMFNITIVAILQKFNVFG